LPGAQATTPIDVDMLERELLTHPDRAFANNLCYSLRFGFDTLVSDVNIPTFECRNLRSALNDRVTVDELIQDELVKGYLLGPFTTPPFPTYRVSPLGVATHKYSGKKRLILDLSSPHSASEHSSINDLIDKDACSLSYVTVDDAIRLTQKLGKNTIYCAFDLMDAFKQCPVDPGQWHLFCVKWNNLYYHFVRLPFGSRSSPVLFNNLSKAVCWIASNNYGIKNILCLLDDYLTCDSPLANGDRTMALMTMIFNKLTIELSVKKTVGPVCEVKYLGVILDSINMEARLPLDKVERIIVFIKSILCKKSCTRKELEQLLGHLNFAMRVLVPGRAFVSYLYRLMCSVKESHYHVHLTKDCRDDLTMWLNFLCQWNGVSMFYEPHLTSASDIALFTAVSNCGFAGFYKGMWFVESWSDNLPTIDDETLSLTFRELVPVCASALIWAKHWRCKRIKFKCDNLATVNIICRGRSKEPVLMKLMRTLVMCAANNNFAIYGEILPSAENDLANSLSHFQMDRFRRLAPGADWHPTPCPTIAEMLWQPV
jgi:hypothetical protein